MKQEVHRIGFPTGNIYVVEENGRYAIVDPGYPRYVSRIEEFITRDLRGSLDQVDLVIVTHNHPDHCGGVDRLMSRCGSAILLAPRRVAVGVGVRIPRPTKKQIKVVFTEVLRDWLRAGCPVAKNRYKTDVTVVLDDDDALPGEFSKWRVINTPGHTHEHISIYDSRTRALICGDVFVNTTGRPAPTSLQTCSEAMAETLSRLRRLRIRSLYPGHGEPIIDRNVDKLISWEKV